MNFLKNLLLSLAVIAVSVTASNVVEVNDKNFDSVVVNSGTPTLVEVCLVIAYVHIAGSYLFLY